MRYYAMTIVGDRDTPYSQWTRTALAGSPGSECNMWSIDSQMWPMWIRRENPHKEATCDVLVERILSLETRGHEGR
jgi:hypothetical protein